MSEKDELIKILQENIGHLENRISGFLGIQSYLSEKDLKPVEIYDKSISMIQLSQVPEENIYR